MAPGAKESSRWDSALPSTPGSSRATASVIDQHGGLAAGQHVVADGDLVDRHPGRRTRR